MPKIVCCPERKSDLGCCHLGTCSPRRPTDARKPFPLHHFRRNALVLDDIMSQAKKRTPRNSRRSKSEHQQTTHFQDMFLDQRQAQCRMKKLVCLKSCSKKFALPRALLVLNVCFKSQTFRNIIGKQRCPAFNIRTGSNSIRLCQTCPPNLGRAW